MGNSLNKILEPIIIIIQLWIKELSQITEEILNVQYNVNAKFIK